MSVVHMEDSLVRRSFRDQGRWNMPNDKPLRLHPINRRHAQMLMCIFDRDEHRPPRRPPQRQMRRLVREAQRDRGPREPEDRYPREKHVLVPERLALLGAVLRDVCGKTNQLDSRQIETPYMLVYIPSSAKTETNGLNLPLTGRSDARKWLSITSLFNHAVIYPVYRPFAANP